MNKTIVDIDRISDCIPKLNIAKSGFYNFESGAFNHSATFPERAHLFLTNTGRGQAHSSRSQTFSRFKRQDTLHGSRFLGGFTCLLDPLSGPGWQRLIRFAVVGAPARRFEKIDLFPVARTPDAKRQVNPQADSL
jgi:hypothetical protein